MVEKKIYLEVEVITKPETKDISCFEASEFETPSAKSEVCEIGRWQNLKENFLNKIFKKI